MSLLDIAVRIMYGYKIGKAVSKDEKELIIRKIAEKIADVDTTRNVEEIYLELNKIKAINPLEGRN